VEYELPNVISNSTLVSLFELLAEYPDGYTRILDQQIGMEGEQLKLLNNNYHL
jgi:hypothetical protein